MKVEKQFRILLNSWLPAGTYQKTLLGFGGDLGFWGVKMIKILGIN
jgi:hypothetical protein